jgi:hypothetical protein
MGHMTGLPARKRRKRETQSHRPERLVIICEDDNAAHQKKTLAQ